MYLEFITDVTNEIIARGIYSDRFCAFQTNWFQFFSSWFNKYV